MSAHSEQNADSFDPDHDGASGGLEILLTPPAPSTACVAMVQPLVLEQVAKALPLQHISRLRRTCIRWDDEFVLVMRHKSATVKFTAEEELVQFIQDMKESRKIPVEAYHLKIESSIAPGLYPKFFQLVGPILKQLQFSVGLDYDDMNFGTLRNAIFGQCPNLIELALTLSSEEMPAMNRMNAAETRNWSLLPKFRVLSLQTILKDNGQAHLQNSAFLAADLIRCAVSLEYLKILNEDENGGVTRRMNLEVLSTMTQGASESLRTLKMYRMNTEELQSLLNLTHRSVNPVNKLHQLVLNLDEEQDARDTELACRLLYSISGAQSLNLKTLEIGKYISQENTWQICFPMLERLELLSVKLWCPDHEDTVDPALGAVGVLFDRPSLHLNFPSLKALEMDYFGKTFRIIATETNEGDFLRVHVSDLGRFFPQPVPVELVSLDATTSQLRIWFPHPARSRLQLRTDIDATRLVALLRSLWDTPVAIEIVQE